MAAACPAGWKDSVQLAEQPGRYIPPWQGVPADIEEKEAVRWAVTAPWNARSSFDVFDQKHAAEAGVPRHPLPFPCVKLHPCASDISTAVAA